MTMKLDVEMFVNMLGHIEHTVGPDGNRLNVGHDGGDSKITTGILSVLIFSVERCE